MKFLRVAGSLIILFCIAFTVFYGAGKISEGKSYEQPAEYKGVLTLWHIETFEGGQGSRKQFLLDVASDFEKNNEGVLVMVVSHTTLSATKNMEDGIYPDMISYGTGTFFGGMKELSVNHGFNGGAVGDKTYALPWCRGGYVLYSNPKLVTKDGTYGKIVISQGNSNLPLASLCLEEGLSFSEIETKTPLEAYIKFVEGKTPYFLGTQRDAVRFSNRGFTVHSKPLTAFNDLYQYISLTSTDELKLAYSEKFIDYLLSENVQKKLPKIAMLSEFYNNTYDLETLNLMQKVTGFSTISAFSSSELIEDVRHNALNAVNGDKDALAKIKNVLILP